MKSLVSFLVISEVHDGGVVTRNGAEAWHKTINPQPREKSAGVMADAGLLTFQQNY